MTTNLPQGLSSFGIPQLGAGLLSTSGDIYWVDSGATRASDGNAGTNKLAPMATIDAAIARCTANNGDIIIVMAGHSETTTAAITMDVAGVRIVGMGWGRSRPTITANFGSAGDTVTVTAANCEIHNVRFVASSATQNAQINLAAADFTGGDLVIEQGANNLIGVTCASGSSRFRLIDCLWLGTADGPDVALDIEAGGINDWQVIRPIFNFGTAGIDLGVIRSSNVMEGFLVEKPIFIGVDTLAVDYNSSAAATGDGLVTDGRIGVSAALTSIEDVLDVGGAQFIETYATDATAAGGRVPITTAS